MSPLLRCNFQEGPRWRETHPARGPRAPAPGAQLSAGLGEAAAAGRPSDLLPFELCPSLCKPALPRGPSFRRGGSGAASVISARGVFDPTSTSEGLEPQPRPGSVTATPMQRRLRAPLPRQPASPFSLGRSPRRRMDRAPPPLLCSVIQTWKVNNTLTSSGVCVLLHGYFPEYLALSKRGALGCPRKGPAPGAGRPGEGRLLRAEPALPGGHLQAPIRSRSGVFAALNVGALELSIQASFWLGGALIKSSLIDLYFYQRHPVDL